MARSARFKERDQAFEDAYRNGSTPAEIAEVAGMSTQHVRYILKRRGLNGADRLAKRNQRVGEAYKSGQSIMTIGRELDLSPQRIMQILQELGVETRPETRERKPDRQRDLAMIAAYQSGLSLGATGEQFGVSAPRILQVLRKYGVPRRAATRLRDPIFDMVVARSRGASLKTIAERNGITPGAVCQRLKKAGVCDQNLAKIRTMKADQLTEYRTAIDTDCLQHPDAIELALEIRTHDR